MTNHVNFSTHDSGSSLDPVLSDFDESLVYCCPLGNAGTSDHQVIFTSINVCPQYDEPVVRTQWLWKEGDWVGFRRALESVNWDTILTGDVDRRVEAFTNIILELMQIFIPHRTFTVKPRDQPWFGYGCRIAADDKSRAWVRYNKNPNRRNKLFHKNTCRKMDEVQQWAIKCWQKDIKSKLINKDTGQKEWWNLMKQQQGLSYDDTIPPLTGEDGTVAISNVDKAELLASFFAAKMSPLSDDCHPPKLDLRTNSKLSSIHVEEHEVVYLLRNIDCRKSIGPDNISPYILKKCAFQLAKPLQNLFNACIKQKIWPRKWKLARVVAIHKKNSKTCVNNYRPISLLSVVGKVYEKIICTHMTDYLERNYLLSLKQFGFRKR